MSKINWTRLNSDVNGNPRYVDLNPIVGVDANDNDIYLSDVKKNGMYNPEPEAGGIPVKMPWASLVRSMLAVMQNPKASLKSQRETEKEFFRMAKLADCYLKAVEREVSLRKEGGAS